LIIGAGVLRGALAALVFVVVLLDVAMMALLPVVAYLERN
jgi:hypothetical protein